MYQPAHFREDDLAPLHDLVDAYSFGTLVAVDDAGGIEISHLPFVLDRGTGERGTLRTHVARANPLARLAAAGRAMTAVFAGPHAYVSPRWYADPLTAVPTWNYAVVHAHAHATAMDEADLVRLLEDLSARHEADAAAPWRFADADAKMRAQLVRGIVGIHLPVERWDGKLKLSQNRSPEDRAGVRRGLEERGTPDDVALLRLMKS